MDGHFVPNLTFGPSIAKMVKKISNIPIEAHLMVSDPLTFGPLFAKTGADYVTVHVEATHHLHRALEAIRDAGAKPGAVINPGTPLITLEPCLKQMELIVVMGVNPGFSGQPFIPDTPLRVLELSRLLKSKNLDIPIEVDGGVSDQNALELFKAGANILVSGSHLFSSPDYGQAIKKLKSNTIL
jgi:ribulose-phosphate 3-epimerase